MGAERARAVLRNPYYSQDHLITAAEASGEWYGIGRVVERVQTEDLVLVDRKLLQHIIDVYIDNGMVEAEDIEAINHLWTACGGEL